MTDTLTPKFDAMLRLADILEAKEGRRYQYDRWRGEHPECGTTACSLGWATIEMGEELDLTWAHGAYPRHGDQDFDAKDRSFIETSETSTHSPFVAGAYAFNITLEEARRLFGVHDKSPSNGIQAAKRLRDFVRCKQREIERQKPPLTRVRNALKKLTERA